MPGRRRPSGAVGTRLRALLVGAPVAVLVAGCGGASGGDASAADPVSPVLPDAGPAEPSATPPPTTASAEPPAPTPSASALRGLWGAADPGGAQIVYEFDDDGTFTRISLLSQERDNGRFRFQDVVEGTFRVDGDTLALRPTAGAQTVEDPDSPEGDDPVSTATSDLDRETHDVELRDGGSVLVLDPEDGPPVVLARQGS